MPSGIDIENIKNIGTLLENGIPDSIYNPSEKSYIISSENPVKSAAIIYAVKKAVIKILNIDFTLSDEICVNFSNTNVIKINMGNILKNECEKYGITNFEISVEDNENCVVASAYAINDNNFCLYRKTIRIFENCKDNVITPEIASKLMPKRKKDVHKGNCGKIYAVAGSVGLTGAAVMACTSALKCGAGLITLGCAKSLNPIFETMLTEVMTKPLSDECGNICGENVKTIISESLASDTLLIGPGLGRKNGISEIIREVLNTDGIYAVIDADGLYAVSKNMSLLENHKSTFIFTPHIGEFSRLVGIESEKILENPSKYAIEFSKKYNVTTVLKSHKTVVASPNGICLVNILGNPGMATGGTGDVLSGAIASFAAQGLKPYDAAVLGVYIHSLAADMASEITGELSLTPSDIINYLPYAIKFSGR